MDIFIVTGADLPYGSAISQQLVELGMRVYGLGRDFSETPFQHPDFIAKTVDLSNAAEIEETFRAIETAEKTIIGLVNTLPYEPINTLECASIEEITNTVNYSVLAPLLLTRYCLPSLVRMHGYLINVCHFSQQESALAATIRGALVSLGATLFSETRDAGVKTSTILIEPNPKGADALAQFRKDPQSVVPAKRVAEALAYLIRFPEGSLPSTLTLSPQALREDPPVPKTIPALKPLKRTLQLPPAEKMPPPDELIPTPTPKRPDDAPSLEELEQWRKEAEEEERLFMERSAKLMGLEPGQEPSKQPASSDQEHRDREGRSKRRRRRGGRNRNRNSGNQGEAAKQSSEPQQRDNQQPHKEQRDSSGGHPNRKSNNRRRSSNKEQQQQRPSPKREDPKPQPPQDKQPKPEPTEKPVAVAKKKAAKKKAAKKKTSAKKKTAAKKKTTTKKKTAAKKKTAQE